MKRKNKLIQPTRPKSQQNLQRNKKYKKRLAFCVASLYNNSKEIILFPCLFLFQFFLFTPELQNQNESSQNE